MPFDQNDQIALNDLLARKAEVDQAAAAEAKAVRDAAMKPIVSALGDVHGIVQALEAAEVTFDADVKAKVDRILIILKNDALSLLPSTVPNNPTA